MSVCREHAHRHCIPHPVYLQPLEQTVLSKELDKAQPGDPAGSQIDLQPEQGPVITIYLKTQEWPGCAKPNWLPPSHGTGTVPCLIYGNNSFHGRQALGFATRE